MVSLLIEAGADVNATDAFGRSAVLLAMWCRHGVAVRRLLAAGADVRARSEKGPNFLSCAALHADVEMVRLALDAGFDPNEGHGSGLPLVMAIRPVSIDFFYPKRPQLKCVQLLIDAGANAQAIDAEGRPLVVRAALSGRVAVLQALLRAGAQPDARDTHGMTASLWAGGHFSKTKVGVLMLRALFEHGARVDVEDGEGCPLLHRAARGLDATGTTCRVVLKAGADVESRDGEGRSALMHAAQHGRVAAAQALLVAGAEVDARDASGWTPLMHAVFIEPRATHAANILPGPEHRMWQSGQSAEAHEIVKRYRQLRYDKRVVVSLLLAAGADPVAHARDGRSVLEIASSDPTDGAMPLLQAAIGAGKASS